MGKVQLAFCIYAENPYGDAARLSAEPKFQALFGAALAFSERMNRCFGKIPRTYFCVGSHLEALERYAGTSAVRKAYAPPRAEVANHTYSHAAINPVRGIDGAYPRHVLTPAEVTAELRRTNTLLQRIFKRRGPFGFSASCGFPEPLPAAVADAIKRAGCSYGHCWTRGPGGSFSAPLRNAAGELRQPFRYPNGLLEIPLSGWQDVFNFPQWTRLLHQLRFGTRWPRTEQQILHWWRQFLEEAVKRSAQGDIVLTHMLHPAYLAGTPFIDRWGFVHRHQGYDEQLRVLRQQLDLAKELRVEMVTMAEIAQGSRSRVSAVGKRGI